MHTFLKNYQRRSSICLPANTQIHPEINSTFPNLLIREKKKTNSEHSIYDNPSTFNWKNYLCFLWK